MRLTITHITRYNFDDPVAYGLQQLRNTPKSSHQQDVLSWTTKIEGGKQELTFEDHHHNKVTLISLDKDTEEVVVTCTGEVEITETHGVVGRHPGPSPLWMYARVTPRTKAGTGVRGLVKKVEGDTELDRLHDLMRVIHVGIGYEKGSSESDWTAEQAIEAGKGVCQDHTHVFLACARLMGLPARYVSGYLMLDDRDEQDAMHAWAEAHVDGLGWVGFDVSNKQCSDARYVRVATGLDYADAAPVTGTRIGGGDEELAVEIAVAQSGAQRQFQQ